MNKRLVLDSLTYQLILLKQSVEILENRREIVESWFDSDTANVGLTRDIGNSLTAIWNAHLEIEKLI